MCILLDDLTVVKVLLITSDFLFLAVVFSAVFLLLYLRLKHNEDHELCTKGEIAWFVSIVILAVSSVATRVISRIMLLL